MAGDKPAPPAKADSGSSRRVALVLGAGGARGLAHIGAIQALLRRDYQIAAIGGSSMGALIGGIHAAGRLDAYRDWACALERGDVFRLLDFTFGNPGFIKGERVINAIRELVGDHRIEDLPIPYMAVATDLKRQREVWLTRGPLFDAIRASIAIPMVLTPHVINGRELVDGGLLAPVPIAGTRMAMVDLVVAVDVSAQVAHRPKPPVVASSDSKRGSPEGEGETESDADADASSLRGRIGNFIDGLLEKSEPAPKQKAQASMLELMSRSLDTMQAQIARLQLALDPPDVLVKVPHDACFFYEFWRARELIEIGEKATDKALDAYEAG